jgi:hypothetical protein
MRNELWDGQMPQREGTALDKSLNHILSRSFRPLSEGIVGVGSTGDEKPLKKWKLLLNIKVVGLEPFRLQILCNAIGFDGILL